MTTLHQSLAEVGRLIRDRQISSVEVTCAALAAAERLNDTLRCFLGIDAEAAVDAAEGADREIAAGRYRGPLHGVPLAHKDAFYVAGRPCSGGSKIRQDFVAPSTATVIERLELAGAVAIGRLNMSEFAAWPTGQNDHYGTPRNPWNPARITGGSSSGSACAVAARIVYGSIGTDTGGSIRLPAGICGVVGLKPTYGRVSRFGVLPRVWSLDAVGPIARTAEDAALLFHAIAGHDPRDATSISVDTADLAEPLSASADGLRIAVPGDALFHGCDAETLTGLENALVVLQSLGATVHRGVNVDWRRLYGLADVVGKVEAAALHAQWLSERPADYQPAVRTRIESGFFIPAVSYVEALRLRTTMLEAFAREVFGIADAMFLPTLTTGVPTLAEVAFGESAGAPGIIARMTEATRSINYLGLPGISVPCGFTADGLPISFQLVGRPFDERTLLQAGRAYQDATSWARMAPPICAAPSMHGVGQPMRIGASPAGAAA